MSADLTPETSQDDERRVDASIRHNDEHTTTSSQRTKASRNRSDFLPPRSRAATSSRGAKVTVTESLPVDRTADGSRNMEVHWRKHTAASDEYMAADDEAVSSVFSPPRSAKVCFLVKT